MIESCFASFLNQKRLMGVAGSHKAPVAKHLKSGHEQTWMGICMLCFRQGKKKFSFARANFSTFKKHYKAVHPNETVSPKDVVPDDSPLAVEVMKAYNKMSSMLPVIILFKISINFGN